MSHIEEHAVLEGFLILLCVFDEDAAGEYQEETETEEKACADFLGIAAVEEPMYAEEDGVANGFIELSGMARQHIYFFEDKSPGHIGNFTDDFGVHEVPEADGTGTDGSDDCYVVEHMYEAQFYVFGIQPKGYHKSEGATVTGKSLVASELPTLTRNIAHG